LKTLILVPMMYSQEDLKGILDRVPQDFQKESDEYWSYIEERLNKIEPSVNSIYMVCSEENIDPRAAQIISSLQAKGAEVHRLEDKALAGEARAWYLMAQDIGGLIEGEFLEEVNRELGDALRRMLDSSLGNMDVGVVFFEPTCRLFLGDDLRVIRMSPFDPRDYLTRYLVLRRISSE